MYNTQFKVKYNDIKTELITKLKNKGEQHKKDDLNNLNNTDDYEYDEEDILDVCDKLYRDELLSVFNAEELTDNKIDKGMNYVYELIMSNESFRQVFNDLEKIYIQEFINVEEKISENQDSIRQLILIMLFSEDIFFMTHKCICQQIELGTIDNDLLVNLKQIYEKILKIT